MNIQLIKSKLTSDSPDLIINAMNEIQAENTINQDNIYLLIQELKNCMLHWDDGVREMVTPTINHLKNLL